MILSIPTYHITEAPLEFTVPLKPQTCKEGETMTFKCEVSEVDLPATWLKDGQELTLSDSVIAEVIGKTHTLTLKDLTKDDTAEYTIKIKDSFESHATLTVEGGLIVQIYTYRSIYLNLTYYTLCGIKTY